MIFSKDVNHNTHKTMLPRQFIEGDNDSKTEHQRLDFEYVSELLDRRGIRAGDIVDQLCSFEVAVPSWALGTGGTRFGRFPVPGQPRDVYEKMDDIAVIHQLTGATPKVSLHIPWDEPDDPSRLRKHAERLNLGFDAVNSNTFQDQPGQERSYRFGSLGHVDGAVRRQAIEHNVHCIEVGESLGSDSITIWLADGSNYPGQMSLRGSFDRVLDSLRDIYDVLPDDWRLFTEHKPYEPAFYATVVQDWGSSLLLAQKLGARAKCLVDLGHHLPNTNIEMVVARLITAGKLGGFHFNDSKYGDDDLTTGSIQPYQLFLVFNELVDAQSQSVPGFAPAYMIDQSHNVKDPIEALLQTVDALQHAYAKALLVDRKALAAYQDNNDVYMAEYTLVEAYRTDVTPLVRAARLSQRGAIDPISVLRASTYRNMVAESRDDVAYAPPQSL